MMFSSSLSMGILYQMVGDKRTNRPHGQMSSLAQDTVITNAIIIDARFGIIKADIGINGNRILYRKMFRTLILVFVLFFSSFGSVFADDGPVPVPDASGLVILEGDVLVAPELQKAAGPIQIVVRLTDAPLSVAVGPGAKQKGSALKPAQQKRYLNTLKQKQDVLLSQIANLGGVKLGQVSKALNAVIVEVDASQIDAIAGLPNVASINPLGRYEVDLSETVPYIGAAAVQTAGFDGNGVRVAVLDSGIDYNHFNLGGSGAVADFDNNDPTIIEAGTFPTAKVVGGYDFVGEVWPDGELAPDADPLDKGSGGAGHGTHVADIIAGKSNDNSHKGVAPGASLYAVGVCSKVSPACSGVALLEGMDFALDPNNDGNIADAVDVINMSLGSSYGQREDDLSFASANAVKFGVVVVCSAGNSADRPYIVSSPSSTTEVISVAQTQVPSAVTYPLEVTGITPSTIANTATVDWAPIGTGFLGPVVRLGLGCPGDSYYNGNNPLGKVALIDRGNCNTSVKVDGATKAGAIAVIVATNAGGDPPSFGFGGGDLPMVPTIIITQADGTRIKTALGDTGVNPDVVASVSPAVNTSLVRSMVASSSRGPSFSYSAIKPDIGAPGASVSAVYGTGDGQGGFSGTSGAAPMVSGSAALVIQKFPRITPTEVKARLMNTGSTQIYTNSATQPGVLAPITRIGGGEVRVNNAIAATTAAWDAGDLTGSLSFGYAALTGSKTFQKKVTVRNYSNTARTYKITSDFRYADDAASGAITITAPATLKVKANSSAPLKVQVYVDVTKLPVWTLNGGSRGGDGFRLQGVEFDGYLNIADATDNIHVAWHVLPHRSAEVTPASTDVTLTDGAGTLALNNTGGALDGCVDVFSLLGTSGRIPPPLLPGNGDNYALIDLKNFGARLVDIVGGELGLQFAVNTFGARAHPNYPAEFKIYLDTNMDGNDDFVIYNGENGGFASSGQNVVAVINLNTGASQIGFFSDADLNSGNIIMTAGLSFLGITPSTQFNVSVYAFDNYFTGNLTDAITGMTYTASAPRYYGTGIPSAGVPTGDTSTLTIQAIVGGDTASPSQLGLLLMYRDARQQREADAIFITP
jgi:subtilisin family serine protease